MSKMLNILCITAAKSSVPSNFLANRQVPNFSLNNCAQSFKKTFMCPKFCTNSVLKYTKCHISTNLSNFLKLCSLYCQKLFALAPTNRRFAEKNWLGGNTGQKQTTISVDEDGFDLPLLSEASSSMFCCPLVLMSVQEASS